MSNYMHIKTIRCSYCNLNGNHYWAAALIPRQVLKSRQLIVPFHKDFTPSGEQLEQRNLAHEL